LLQLHWAGWPLRVFLPQDGDVDSNAVSARGGGAGFPWWVIWAGAAVFCFSAALYFSGRERQYVEETVRLRKQLEFATTRVTEWREARPILENPGAIAAGFGTGEPNALTGRIFASAGQGVVLIASHLPPLAAAKTYEMWLWQPGKKPLPAGVFQPDEDGSAIHVKRGAGAAMAGDTILVTVENEGGGAQPAPEPLVALSLPAIHQP